MAGQRPVSDAARDTLEADFVDRFGVQATVLALSRICEEKAAHLEENWQDEAAANVWQRVANDLFAFAARKSVKELVRAYGE